MGLSGGKWGFAFWMFPLVCCLFCLAQYLLFAAVCQDDLDNGHAWLKEKTSALQDLCVLPSTMTSVADVSSQRFTCCSCSDELPMVVLVDMLSLHLHNEE